MEHDDVIPIRPAEKPAPQRASDTPAAGGVRRVSSLLAASAATVSVAYGTQVALSLTAVVGRRAELLLSIRPGPLAAGGGALALVLAWVARRAGRSRP